jgi:dipeptidyl aminopeptidase/acylaminoacyl peptidase
MVNLTRIIPLAAEGYFVIASQYRGSNGKENNGVDQFGGGDINDVLKLVEIIDSNPLVDSKKIALWGGSRGGMMALMAARGSNRFSAIILASTPVDLFAELTTTHGKRMEKNVFKKRIPDYEKNKKRELTNRSAILWVEQLNPKAPILILHSRDDDRVDPANSLRFASRLQELKFPYKLVIYETGGHTLENRQVEYNHEIYTWLKAYLR